MQRTVCFLGWVGLVVLSAACSSTQGDQAQTLDSAPRPAEKSDGGTSSGVGGTAASGASSGSASGGTAGTALIVGESPEPADPSTAGPSGTGGSTAAAGSDSHGSDPPDATPAGPDSDSEGTGQNNASPGTLTAGAWDDNRNFDFFLAYRKRMDVIDTPGLLPVDADEYRAAHSLYAQTAGPKQTLDVALVIDTTGSMTDEIAYLQSEFSALSQVIATQHPNAEQRWSLIVYRDVGDEYVVRAFDFDTDTSAFQKHLAAQIATGGGDFPEAPEQALAQVTELGWRTEDTTARLAFWVADAPNHPEQAEAMSQAIRDVGSLGVHLYPVASSGIDETTELTMRSAAQLTGGRYLFLTDDSGVGGAHKEPTIPCYFVTKLDTAIERMVDIELSGEYHEPDAAEVIRTGGEPQSGACKLESGDTVVAY